VSSGSSCSVSHCLGDAMFATGVANTSHLLLNRAGRLQPAKRPNMRPMHDQLHRLIRRSCLQPKRQLRMRVLLPYEHQHVDSVNIEYVDCRRNFSFLWVYIGFDVFACVMIYWYARIPKKSSKEKREECSSALFDLFFLFLSSARILSFFLPLIYPQCSTTPGVGV
jgi:hypothetical protein